MREPNKTIEDRFGRGLRPSGEVPDPQQPGRVTELTRKATDQGRMSYIWVAPGQTWSHQREKKTPEFAPFPSVLVQKKS